MRRLGSVSSYVSDTMFLHYLRTALAGLRLRKQTTLINVVGLTLGMTCFVLAYVITGYLGSADRHYAKHERIYLVQQRNLSPADDAAEPFAPSSSRSLEPYLRARVPELEGIARRADLWLRVDADDRRLGLLVTFADADLLRMFDFRFVAGDPTSALDEPTAAVVSDRVAEQLFGTREALGRVFSVSRQVGRPFEAVVRGVVEESDELSTLGFPNQRSGILLNFSALEALPNPEIVAAAGTDDWSAGDFNALTYVLLPADGSLTQAALDERLAAIGTLIVPANGDTVSFRTRSLENHFDDSLTAILSLLGIFTAVQARQLFFAPGLLILAMACFNYVNLTVAIAATRAKEVGMSKVLGASARQVIQQHLIEAGAAVVVSFGCALALALMIVTALNTALNFSIDFSACIGPEFWAMSASVAVATTIAAGAYPAWVMSRFRPLESLRAGAKRSGSSLLRSVFIGGQFAVASALLTAVLVMYAQNAAMRDEIERLPVDPYVQLANNLLETPDVDPEVMTAALLASPSIKGVTGMAETVFSVTLAADPFLRSGADAAPLVNLRSRYVSYDFFSTLGIDLLAGREFARGRDIVERRDGTERGALGIVVDRQAARLLGWENPRDAVGQTIYRQTRTAAGLGMTSAGAFEIIGVVDQPPLQGVSGGLANIYRLDPYNTYPLLRLARDDVAGALAHIERVWRDLVPDSPLRPVSFVDESFDQAILEMNVFTTALLSIVAFGFLVALAGIFGMALFVASRRRHEIGVRKSLGAGTKQILRQLLVEFGRPVLIGNLIAWPAAYALAQLYVQLWLERAPVTPWPYLLSLAITLAIAWLGFGRQALLAARLQPARVLRYE